MCQSQSGFVSNAPSLNVLQKTNYYLQLEVMALKTTYLAQSHNHQNSWNLRMNMDIILGLSILNLNTGTKKINYY
ncbi:hypothetical protein AAG906_006011 [Vitis piasezkii]